MSSLPKTPLRAIPRRRPERPWSNSISVSVKASTCYAARCVPLRWRRSSRAPRRSIAAISFPAICGRSSDALGLLGPTVEEEFGGAGMGYLEHVVAMEEISRESGADWPVLRRALQPVRQPAQPLGYSRTEAPLSAEAAERRACRCARHERAGFRIGCHRYAYAGGTRGDHYVLNGNKMWITNGPEADVVGRVRNARSGARRERHHDFHRRKGHARILERAEARQAGHARLGHERAGVSRLPACRSPTCCTKWARARAS